MGRATGNKLKTRLVQRFISFFPSKFLGRSRRIGPIGKTAQRQVYGGVLRYDFGGASIFISYKAVLRFGCSDRRIIDRFVSEGAPLLPFFEVREWSERISETRH
ncbi:hypothetical protein HNR44_001788 [Geomicrobium halophilum]|uniref:Uncharacterized protein n=1 Tax=Geomicrobium halophilum TaxID=549000 RepID=A0A841PM25_9BACL|nr:hypothetical protein [Geomicrobium halophilum]